jgi:CRISPR/Cas system-associated endonuclease/helicase Cas3
MMTIQAHGIPSIDTEWGSLSEAQNRLLTDSAPIRICGAPTGSGKTYAFIRAARERSLIIFVVPTQALAKDIEEDARNAEVPVCVWDGRQSEDLRKKGKELWVVRKEEIDRLKITGGMLITTPETLQAVCFGKRQQYDRIRLGVADLLQAGHIVFDEAHTLSVRAFGFLHFFAVLAVYWHRVEPEKNKVKLTWLSATHSNLFDGFFDEGKDGGAYIPKKYVSPTFA